MVQNLTEYLAEHPCKGFKAVPHYFPDGDFLTYYHRDAPCYSQRVDDLITVYLTMDTHELVGCKIKGVCDILAQSGSFGVKVADSRIKLGFFFLFGVRTAREDDQKKRVSGTGPDGQ